MKYYWLLFFTLFSLNSNAQTDTVSIKTGIVDTQHYYGLNQPKSPRVIYHPFYNDIQMIEIDFYNYNLDMGSWEDLIHPRGGSSYHDALTWGAVLNGYVFRNRKGEILKEYNTHSAYKFKLLPVDKAKTILHAQRFNEPINISSGGFTQTNSIKLVEQYGPYYIVNQLPNQGAYTISSEREIGLIDSLGNFKIQPEYSSIQFVNSCYIANYQNVLFLFDAQFEFLIEKAKGIHPIKNNLFIVKKEKWGCINSEGEVILPFIYDSYQINKDESIDFYILSKKKYHLKQ